MVLNVLHPSINARYIRVHPKTWQGHISMRMELLGCPSGTDNIVRFQENEQKAGPFNECFVQNICSERQILPTIFYYLRKAKNFLMTVPLMYNFRSLSNKSLRLCEVQFFKLHSPLNVMDDVKMHRRFRKNNAEALVISKRFKFL